MEIETERDGKRDPDRERNIQRKLKHTEIDRE
jgi:hypothetical protein